MTQSEWMKIVGWMCQLWPHSPIEPQTATAWWPFVTDLDAETARQAVAHIALEPGRRFPPGVGDIVDQATVELGRDWFDAWQEVYDAVAGTSGRVRYHGDDPLVARFLAQVGEWREKVDEANPTLRAQFRDFYRSQGERDVVDRRHQLAGEVVGRLADAPQYQALTAGSR